MIVCPNSQLDSKKGEGEEEKMKEESDWDRKGGHKEIGE